jgi:hypothetical protein
MVEEGVRARVVSTRDRRPELPAGSEEAHQVVEGEVELGGVLLRLVPSDMLEGRDGDDEAEAAPGVVIHDVHPECARRILVLVHDDVAGLAVVGEHVPDLQDLPGIGPADHFEDRWQLNLALVSPGPVIPGDLDRVPPTEEPKGWGAKTEAEVEDPHSSELGEPRHRPADRVSRH